MKKVLVPLMIGLVMVVVSGCSTKSASSDDSRMRTSYTMPADSDTTAATANPGWSLSPAIEP